MFNCVCIYDAHELETEKNHLKGRKGKHVSLQAKICNMHFEQNFFWPPEVGVSQWHTHTDRHTDGHCDTMTESV